MSLFALSFISYFGYFREAFFIDSARQKIWMFEVAKSYDAELRDKAKQAVIKDVLSNPDLPDKVAPLLVNLV